MKADERRRTIEARKEDTKRRVKLWCKDEWRDFEVFSVPVEALLLNVDNRRFKAEKILMEDKLQRSLDPENNPLDEQSVVSILLDTALEVDGDRVVGKPSTDAESLQKDWLARGQETPFWIRPDGTVRNGNRRLAMILRLRSDLGASGSDRVQAIILDPKDIDERDLFEMEQREQLTENLKVRYTDINLLLTLREAAIARGVDWNDPQSIEKVAGQLQDVARDKAYATIQLRAIRYMDAFLQDANAPGRYQTLLRQVERFRDVGKIMAQIENDYPDDAADILRLAFAAIRAGNPHGDIRLLRKIFIDDRERYKRLLAAVEREEAPWDAATTDAQVADPKIVSTRREEDDETDEGDDDPPGPVVPNYPSERVKTKIKDAIDGFQSRNLNALSMLEQAHSRLESLTKDRKTLSAALAGDEADQVRKAIAKVVAWAEDAKRFLKAK